MVDDDGMQRRILLVEHDRRAALALAGTVTRAGDHVVGRATHLEDALRKVAALAPELVLVDVAITSDGARASEVLRARCGVPVLLVADRTRVDLSSLDGPHVGLDVAVPELAVMIELLCRGVHDVMRGA